VRTLLPLANHVRAVLASRDADLEGSSGRSLDRAAPARPSGSIDAAAAPMAAAPARDKTSACAARRTACATSSAATHPSGGGSSC
jgi:hypothetical protein